MTCPRLLFSGALALLLLAVHGTGQDVPAAKPRRDAKRGDFAVFPLGPVGGSAEVVAGSAEVRVLGVTADAPGARAGLRVGDRIVGIDAAAFVPHVADIDVGGAGPMASLGDAIERVEGAGGVLKLKVLRDGAEAEIDVVLAKAGRYRGSWSGSCEKSEAFHDAVCRDLVRTQQKSGAWRSRTGADADRYVTALCGLALLARGDPAHLPALRKAAIYLQGPHRRGYVQPGFQQPAGLSNWFICASGIFLAEYALATGDERPRPTVQFLADCMAARMDRAGRFGHGITVGYSGKGFNVINTHAQLLWALARRIGCKVDRAAWSASRAEIEKSVGPGGGVRYWTLQTGYWDACARTGQMALALHLAGEAPHLVRRMGSYLEKHHLRMREAHAMGSIGMIFGTAALARVNRSGWKRHMAAWVWYLNLMRQPAGGAGYIGGKRNNGGDFYLRQEHVANAIAGVMLASGRSTLHLFGNQRRGWLRLRKEAAEGAASGRRRRDRR